MWFIQTVEYDLAIKGNEMLMYTVTWMNFKNTMFSERSHHQRPRVV